MSEITNISRPILFSAPMVRAILGGTKTQTRRIMKPQPDEDAIITIGAIGDSCGVAYVGNSTSGGIVTRCPCPYGKPGDLLWLRETWRIGAWNEDTGEVAIDYCDGPRKEWVLVPEDPDDYHGESVFERYWKQCCDELAAKGVRPDQDERYRWPPGDSPLRWRPSIHMPRWASRVTLRITGVRVERLQDISREDAMAEGIDRWDETASITPYRNYRKGRPGEMELHCSCPERSFMTLWESINGGGSWAANPWVWVIEFEKVSP